jgi:secreted trypsin-like serine protease
MGRIRFALLACLGLVLLTAAPVAHAQSPQPRVIGGSDSSTSQYPWQAAVVTDARFGGNDFDRQFCGGSLITPTIVITAAHCVFDTDPDDGFSQLDPNDVDVILGRTTLTGTDGVEHDVSATSYQSNYDPDTLQNDVGYLVLTTSSTQTPIQIASPEEAGLWDPDSLEEVTGWGTTSWPGGARSDTLQSATVPIVDDSTCGSPTVYGSDFDPATMVCAGYMTGGVDTCQGDSGGPMQAPVGDGTYRLVGITSWGTGCAMPNFPGVYTRVAGPALSSAIASKVGGLEAGEQAPSGGGWSAGTITPTTRASDPFAKCRKLKSKKKRKRCNRKVRKRLGR